MLAIGVNAILILIGSTIGLLVKNNIKKTMTDATMIGIGLFTVYIGITGLSTENNAVIYLLAIVFGGVIGTVFQLEEKANRYAAKIQDKLPKDDAENRFASGFAGFFIVSAVGAYTVVASFNAGLGDNTMLYTKSVMDFIVSMAMASSLGAGVLFAGIPIILYETVLYLFCGSLIPLFSDLMIDSFSCIGAILTIAIGTNILKISDFKIVNYIPSLILAPLFSFIFAQF